MPSEKPAPGHLCAGIAPAVGGYTGNVLLDDMWKATWFAATRPQPYDGLHPGNRGNCSCSVSGAPHEWPLVRVASHPAHFVPVEAPRKSRVECERSLLVHFHQ